NFNYVRMSHKELVVIMGCLHDILIKSAEKEDVENPDTLRWYSDTLFKILNHVNREDYFSIETTFKSFLRSFRWKS
uniref:hypothetical protein n=1 Tax=Xenorhabdus sp. PB61.4 TaxID=2788940 RepID=UPI001E4900DB